MTRPIPPRRVRPQLPLAAYRWLLQGQRSAWYYLELTTDPATQRLFWEQHRDAVVLHHTERRPGTRLKLWWRFDAPEPRRCVGGIGTPLHECGGAWAELYEYGVPMDWKTSEHNLRAGTPLSADDPPRFESEASFLRRHGLLLRAERARLSRRSYEPCVLLHRAGYYQLMSQDRFKHERASEFERIGPLRALLNVGTER
jgi:hypothetical protein